MRSLRFGPIWSILPRIASATHATVRLLVTFIRDCGAGIATAAARELLRLGFGEHGRHRIFGTCDPRNLASAAVLRRIGMRYEGRMRGTTVLRDGWRDSDLYARLAAASSPSAR